MVFKDFSVLGLWMKVASALEGLTDSISYILSRFGFKSKDGSLCLSPEIWILLLVKYGMFRGMSAWISG